MEIIKVHFGARKPDNIEYVAKPDGIAEAWLYNNIEQVMTADGDKEFVADGIFVVTRKTQEEIEGERDTLFSEANRTTDTERIADLEEAISLLAEVMFGGDE